MCPRRLARELEDVSDARVALIVVDGLALGPMGHRPPDIARAGPEPRDA